MIYRLQHDVSNEFRTLRFQCLTGSVKLDFQQHFKEIARQYSPVQRPFYVHLTSVIVRDSFHLSYITLFNSILIVNRTPNQLQ